MKHRMPSAAILIATLISVLFIPYTTYFTCHNTCTKDGWCTEMWCPPLTLNLVHWLIDHPQEGTAPTVVLMMPVVIKALLIGLVVYAAFYCIHRFSKKKS